MASVDAIFVVGKVAERRYLVHVAFELDHCRWRPVFDDELDGSHRLENAAPLGPLRLELAVEESADSLNIGPIEKRRSARFAKDCDVGSPGGKVDLHVVGGVSDL